MTSFSFKNVAFIVLQKMPLKMRPFLASYRNVLVSYHQQSNQFKNIRHQSSVADRFSWLLTENNKSGVVDGLKDTYK